jgi:O-antigen/teichoic acid export membrane protein
VSLRGILEATQRFGTVAIVRAVSGSSIFLLPTTGVAFHLGLDGIVGLLVVSSLATAIIYLVIDLVMFPALRRPKFDRTSLRGLFGFGGWTTLSSVAILSLLYGDRVILAARAPIATLTYYSVPYDLVTRLQVIPAAFATVLFPTFTSVLAGDPTRVRPLYLRTVRYSFLMMALPTFAAILLAHPILTLWLGSDFATRGTLVMELLAAGVLANAVAQVPANLLDALGRPDLRAKIFLALVPGYLGTAWILITYWGAVGAASGWAIRASLELCIFFVVAYSLLRLSPRDIADIRLGRGWIWLVAVGAIAVLLNSVAALPTWTDLEVHVGVLAVAAFAFWMFLLDAHERIALRSIAFSPWRLSRLRPPQAGPDG